MSRDRLTDFQAAIAQNNTIEIDLISPQPLQSIDNFVFIDDLFLKANKLHSCIQYIETCVNNVNKLYASILAAPTYDANLTRELDERTAEIKAAVFKVKSQLSELKIYIDEKFANLTLSQAEFRIGKAQFELLTQSLVKAIKSFNQTQMEHRENCKKRIQRQLEITGKKANDQEIETMIESKNLQIFTSNILMETKQAKQTLADIEARHTDILKLEESIKEINVMFTDLALLIDEQSEQMNSIESNFNSIVNYVEKGKKDLGSAEEEKKKASKKKVLVISIVIAVVIILVIILIAVISSNFK